MRSFHQPLLDFKEAFYHEIEIGFSSSEPLQHHFGSVSYSSGGTINKLVGPINSDDPDMIGNVPIEGYLTIQLGIPCYWLSRRSKDYWEYS